MKQESKTLREFSLETATKAGTPVKLYFGYDTSAYHGGFFVSAAIGAAKMKNDMATIKKIGALGIPAINSLIGFVGCDVTGVPYNLQDASELLLTKFVAREITIDAVLEFYRLGIESEQSVIDLATKFLSQPSRRASLMAKFNRSQRVRMLEESRKLIQDLRELQLQGNVKFEGILHQKANPLYYKRDLDYVRKARIRLFRDVLKLKYRPF